MSDTISKTDLDIKMDKVYLRNVIGEEELRIYFSMKSDKLQIDRTFNLCRCMSEKVRNVMARLRSTILKEVNKNRQSGIKKFAGFVPLPMVSVSMTRNGEELCESMTLNELIQDYKAGNSYVLRIVDICYEVVYNLPCIDALSLPTILLPGCIIYPCILELKNADLKLCKGIWYRSTKPNVDNWQRCGEGLYYLTNISDGGIYFKLVLTPANAEGVVGSEVETITRCPLQDMAKEYCFLRRHALTGNILSDNNQMRVISYNILADHYASTEYAQKTLFSYCSTFALEIAYRKQIFLKEICGYNADILCLQEVDSKIYKTDLEIIFSNEFSFYFSLKGKNPEGIAIMYRTKKYELIENYAVNFGQEIQRNRLFDKIWQKIKNNKAFTSRYCNLGTVLQVVVLKCKNTDRYILCANTHLYFHPDGHDIRLMQLGCSMIFIEHVYGTLIDKKVAEPKNIVIVFCGDFNSVPDCSLYKLMTEGCVISDVGDWHNNSSKAVTGIVLKHRFKMSSACGTPEFTNYTTQFAGCLDYIFYQSDRLEVVKNYPFPDKEELSRNVAIPSPTFPSDHVALVADLKFKC